MTPLCEQSAVNLFFPRLCALVFSTLAIILCSHAWSDDDMDFDRSQYGHAPYAIWSSLNPFETRALADLPLAKEGDADALLELFLLAAGDVRDEQNYRGIKNRLEAWIASIQPTMSRIHSQQRLGSRLLAAMHEEFFLEDKAGDNLLAGYNLDQSKLSTIFSTKIYNCISSALLYIVIAEKFGIKTQGVILPSHAFVQLTLDNGDTVDVETTSANGFALLHDEQFYANAAQSWSSDRGLEPVTYADYQARDIVEPYLLGTHDMWSQHTEPERMSYQDRMRVAEMRSVLLPDDIEAQQNRLYFYNKEFNYFKRHEQHDLMVKLYDTIDPYLAGLHQRNFDDPQFTNMLAWADVQKGFAWIISGRDEAALQWARELMNTLPNDVADYDKLQENLYFVVTQYVINSVNQGLFTRAKRALHGIEKNCLHFAHCAEGISSLYAKWGQRYWEQRQWPQVMAIIEEYLAIDDSSEKAKLFWQNYEAAYINLANQYVFDEDRGGAKDVLERCVSAAMPADRCQRALRKLDETGKLH